MSAFLRGRRACGVVQQVNYRGNLSIWVGLAVGASVSPPVFGEPVFGEPGHAQAALITALVSAVTHMRSAHYRGIEGRALAVTRSHRGSASYFSSLGGVCVAAENTVARRISTDAHKFCFTARSAVAHMALLTILSLVSRSNRASAH